MAKFVVMTSIFEPSEAVGEFARMSGWQLVVVADRKTPAGWHYDNVTFLSVAEQLDLGYPLLKDLSWNHYARKMLGYLYALQHGADIIADVDDDNIPLPGWDALPPDQEFDTITNPGFVNIYRFFTDEFIWPRGFPLEEIRSTSSMRLSKRRADIGVWQFLANGDPDVDAIYRLIFDKPVEFSDRSPIVLDQGVFCPFNSQNTVFMRNAFPILYLPAFVTFRFTDILRGIVAQPLLWAEGLRLGFGHATAIQKRNPHDYLKDFESEIPVYLHIRQVADLAAEAVVPGKPMHENLLFVYESLAMHGIVPPQEVGLCQSWAESLRAAGGIL